jgi:hypothetical protein
VQMVRKGKAMNKAGGETKGQGPNCGDGEGAQQSVLGGDWSVLEAVPAATTSTTPTTPNTPTTAAAGGGDCNTYLFAGGEAAAWLGGAENKYHFVVITQVTQAKFQVGLGRFLLHLAPGPPARLRIELRGLPPAVAAGGDGGCDGVIRFMGTGAGGGGGGVVERVDGWPRHCRIGAVAVQLLDAWGNTVPAQAGRGSLPRQPPTLEAAGAMLVVGQGKEPARSWRCVDMPSSTAQEVKFTAVHFAADDNATEARLIVRCALGGGPSQTPLAAAASELYAEMLFGLVRTNRVVRLNVNAPNGAAVGGQPLRAGEMPDTLVVTVETEDGTGFCGPGPDLVKSLVAECSYKPSPLAGNEVDALVRAAAAKELVLYHKPVLAGQQPSKVEKQQHCSAAEDFAGVAAGGTETCEGSAGLPGLAVLFEGVKGLWGPGEYLVLVKYKEQREDMLLNSLLLGDSEVASEPIRFQVRTCHVDPGGAR